MAGKTVIDQSDGLLFKPVDVLHHVKHDRDYNDAQ